MAVVRRKPIRDNVAEPVKRVLDKNSVVKPKRTIGEERTGFAKVHKVRKLPPGREIKKVKQLLETRNTISSYHERLERLPLPKLGEELAKIIKKLKTLRRDLTRLKPKDKRRTGLEIQIKGLTQTEQIIRSLADKIVADKTERIEQEKLAKIGRDLKAQEVKLSSKEKSLEEKFTNFRLEYRYGVSVKNAQILLDIVSKIEALMGSKDLKQMSTEYITKLSVLKDEIERELSGLEPEEERREPSEGKQITSAEREALVLEKRYSKASLDKVVEIFISALKDPKKNIFILEKFGRLIGTRANTIFTLIMTNNRLTPANKRKELIVLSSQVEDAISRISFSSKGSPYAANPVNVLMALVEPIRREIAKIEPEQQGQAAKLQAVVARERDLQEGHELEDKIKALLAGLGKEPALMRQIRAEYARLLGSGPGKGPAYLKLKLRELQEQKLLPPGTPKDQKLLRAPTPEEELMEFGRRKELAERDRRKELELQARRDKNTRIILNRLKELTDEVRDVKKTLYQLVGLQKNLADLIRTRGGSLEINITEIRVQMLGLSVNGGLSKRVGDILARILSEIEKNHGATKEDLRVLTEISKGLDRKAEESLGRIKGLETTVKAIAEDISKNREELSEMGRGLKEQLDEIMAEIRNTKKEPPVVGDFEKISNRLDIIISQVGENTDLITSMAGLQKSLEDVIKSNKSDLKDVKEALANMKTLINDSEDRLSEEFTSAMQVISGQINGLVETSEEGHRLTRGQLTFLATVTRDLKNRVSEGLVAIDKLKDEVKGMSGSVKALESASGERHKDITAKMDRIMRDIEDARNDIGTDVGNIVDARLHEIKEGIRTLNDHSARVLDRLGMLNGTFLSLEHFDKVVTESMGELREGITVGYDQIVLEIKEAAEKVIAEVGKKDPEFVKNLENKLTSLEEMSMQNREDILKVLSDMHDSSTERLDRIETQVMQSREDILTVLSDITKGTEADREIKVLAEKIKEIVETRGAKDTSVIDAIEKIAERLENIDNKLDANNKVIADILRKVIQEELGERLVRMEGKLDALTAEGAKKRDTDKLSNQIDELKQMIAEMGRRGPGENPPGGNGSGQGGAGWTYGPGGWVNNNNIFGGAGGPNGPGGQGDGGRPRGPGEDGGSDGGDETPRGPRGEGGSDGGDETPKGPGGKDVPEPGNDDAGKKAAEDAKKAKEAAEKAAKDAAAAGSKEKAFSKVAGWGFGLAIPGALIMVLLFVLSRIFGKGTTSTISTVKTATVPIMPITGSAASAGGGLLPSGFMTPLIIIVVLIALFMLFPKSK